MVLAMVGLMAAVIAPRLRLSAQQRVQAAAVQLAQDLDVARTRALTTRRSARMTFDATNHRYDGFLADAG